MEQRVNNRGGPIRGTLLAGFVAFSVGACEHNESAPDSDGEYVSRLTGNVVVDDSVWELAPNQPELSRLHPPSDVATLDEAAWTALRREAEADPTWRAADGTRYESMMVTPGGKVYGSKGPAPSAPRPTEENRYGSNGIATGEALKQLEPEGTNQKSRIWTDYSIDDRARVNSGSLLGLFPFSVIGPLYWTTAGATQNGRCTATKIGPRHLLTASHCVFSDTGVWTVWGRWNAAQTASAATNGNFEWNGVSARDWRLGWQWDYAVIYVDDSPAIAGLSWEGVTWSDTMSWYTPLSTSLMGYPCGGAESDCGVPSYQRCAQSPEADKRCNGWLYFGFGSSGLSAGSDLLAMPQDCSSGQSGSSLILSSGGVVSSLGLFTHSLTDQVCRGPKFRTAMWNDVCAWIGSVDSVYASHSLCP